MFRAKATLQGIIKSTLKTHKQYIEAQNAITNNPDYNHVGRERMRSEIEAKYTEVIEKARKDILAEFDLLAKETAEEYRRKDAARYASRDYTPKLQATLQVLEAAKCGFTPEAFAAYVKEYTGDPVATAAINTVVSKYMEPMRAEMYKLPDERKNGAEQVEKVKRGVMNLLNNFTIGSGYPEAFMEPSANSVCDYIAKCNDMLTVYSGNGDTTDSTIALYRNYSTMAGHGGNPNPGNDERKHDSKAVKAVW